MLSMLPCILRTEMPTWKKVKHSILKNSHISIRFMEKQFIQLKQIIAVHKYTCFCLSEFSLWWTNISFIVKRALVQGQSLIFDSFWSKQHLIWMFCDYLLLVESQSTVLKSNLCTPTWRTLMSHGPFIIAITPPPTFILHLMLASSPPWAPISSSLRCYCHLFPFLLSISVLFALHPLSVFLIFISLSPVATMYLLVTRAFCDLKHTYTEYWP